MSASISIQIYVEVYSSVYYLSIAYYTHFYWDVIQKIWNKCNVANLSHLQTLGLAEPNMCRDRVREVEC